MSTDTPGIDVFAGDGDEFCTKSGERPWLGIHFDCCGFYTRIYRNAEGTAYVGWCPGCQRRIRVKVEAGGRSERFFRAS
ncbi:MAG: hypothetical protein ACE5GE_02535 [Phycisphaerae bacterium]